MHIGICPSLLSRDTPQLCTARLIKEVPNEIKTNKHNNSSVKDMDMLFCYQKEMAMVTITKDVDVVFFLLFFDSPFTGCDTVRYLMVLCFSVTMRHENG